MEVEVEGALGSTPGNIELSLEVVTKWKKGTKRHFHSHSKRNETVDG